MPPHISLAYCCVFMCGDFCHCLFFNSHRGLFSGREGLSDFWVHMSGSVRGRGEFLTGLTKT